MAGTMESVKGYLDRQTYRMYLPLDSDQQFRQSSGSWVNLGSFGRVFRTDNVGTTAMTWTFRKPEDWVRGTTHPYLWVQAQDSGGGYGDELAFDVNGRFIPVETDYSVDGTHIQIIDDDDDMGSIPALEDELYRWDMQDSSHIKDIVTAGDGLITVRVRRIPDDSDSYVYFFGLELIYTPTVLER
jgi:hypothetical protein